MCRISIHSTEPFEVLDARGGQDFGGGMTPTQTRHYLGEIPQIYHRFALLSLIPQNMGGIQRRLFMAQWLFLSTKKTLANVTPHKLLPTQPTSGGKKAKGKALMGGALPGSSRSAWEAFRASKVTVPLKKACPAVGRCFSPWIGSS